MGVSGILISVDFKISILLNFIIRTLLSYSHWYFLYDLCPL